MRNIFFLFCARMSTLSPFFLKKLYLVNTNAFHVTGQEEGLRVLGAEDRVTATEFRDAIQSSSVEATSASTRRPYLLIDVRPKLETSICRLPDSINLPYQCLEQRAGELVDLVRQHLPQQEEEEEGAGSPRPSPLLPGQNSSVTHTLNQTIPGQLGQILLDIM